MTACVCMFLVLNDEFTDYRKSLKSPSIDARHPNLRRKAPQITGSSAKAKVPREDADGNSGLAGRQFVHETELW